MGFSRYGVTDVSLRYSKDHKATRLRQQQLLDPNLASGICGEYTSHLRNGLEDEEARLWRERDEVELRELLREEHHPEQPLPGESSLYRAKQQRQLVTHVKYCNWHRNRLESPNLPLWPVPYISLRLRGLHHVCLPYYFA